MVKFPSQNKLTYQTGDLSYANYAAITSGGVSGHLNLPKDLALINRRGYASTDRKGVPLVFQTRFDFYLHDEDGAYGPPSVLDNLMVTLKISGCQNNWVYRNAGVKWQAAREAMFRKAGVPKKNRGAYAHEIRYNWDSNNDTWLVPIDAAGDAFAGGTWDATSLTTEDDAAFQLRLTGAGVDEDADLNVASVNSAFSYLSSRGTVAADSNLEVSEVPAKRSLINDFLDKTDIAPGTKDDIIDLATDEQDNPPYDEFVSDDTNNDITEAVELGRCLSSTQAAVGSVIVEIPYGICDLQARAYTSESTSSVTAVRGLIHATVLDIYPMQG